MKNFSITDVICIGVLILFIGACSYVTNQEEDAQIVSIEEEVHTIADVLPYFDDCQDKTCSDKKLIAFIYDGLEYPEEAREAGKEGRVYVEFVVNRYGRLQDIKVLRDDLNAGQSAIDLVSSMNDKYDRPFSPGLIDGSEVNVKYVLPITYKLES